MGFHFLLQGIFPTRGSSCISCVVVLRQREGARPCPCCLLSWGGGPPPLAPLASSPWLLSSSYSDPLGQRKVRPPRALSLFLSLTCSSCFTLDSVSGLHAWLSFPPLCVSSVGSHGFGSTSWASNNPLLFKCWEIQGNAKFSPWLKIGLSCGQKFGPYRKFRKKFLPL